MAIRNADFPGSLVVAALRDDRTFAAGAIYQFGNLRILRTD